jgi:phosphatidate phosphatase PAH1
MRLVELCLLLPLVACAVDTGTPDDADDDSVPTTPTSPQPQSPSAVRCAGAPDAGPAGDWHHLKSNLIAELGDPHHRGIDLIATPDDATQAIAGRVTYGPTDKDLEDEDVDLFACISDMWQPIGRARTDGDGRFTLSLEGSKRLPEGIRDLYLSVVGDRTGVSFVGLVAAAHTHVVVSDVDGTLTASENAYPTSLVTGDDVAAQPDAAARLTLASEHGATIIYLSTRGDRFTQDTREWLAAKGFPFGALRLPSSLITIPGEDTVEAKTSMLDDLAAFDILAGVGNRHTDVEAYTDAGVAADHIFIKLPEFSEEVATDISQRKAVGVDAYVGMPM